MNKRKIKSSLKETYYSIKITIIIIDITIDFY